ncbi:MAG: guanylate kinase [Rhodobacteraceae bacterium]|nr:guanylate kinase [Paracoccaceae bacterium]
MSDVSQNNRYGLLIILSSPSGAGKTTLSRRLQDWDRFIEFSVSATTRPCRKGEIHGREYYFHTPKEFEQMINEGAMLEYAEVFGNLYGSPLAPVEVAIRHGRDVLFDVDWQGGQQVRSSSLGKHALSVFLLPPSILELERRLVSRQQDAKEVIDKRMAECQDEISHWSEYDYVLVNDDLDNTEEKLKTIITAERLRLSQQPLIAKTARALNREFEGRA